MARIFISHSSENDTAAVALQSWLLREGWGQDDIYLDISPDSGMAAGQRWIQALDDAQRRCEAVIFLVSSDWIGSKWCKEEYERARDFNKKLFALIIDPAVDLTDLPQGLTSQWQVVWLVPQGKKDTPSERFDTVHPLTQKTDLFRFTNDGLKRLKNGLRKAAISPDSFTLQKDPDGPLGWRMPYRGLEALQIEDAAVFFGRDAEISKGLDVLRGLANSGPPYFMAILGASGSGKSSFIRAGLLPRLIRDNANWLPLEPLRTGDDGPIEADDGLLAALTAVHKDVQLNQTKTNLRKSTKTSKDFISCLKQLRQAGAKQALLDESDRSSLPILFIDQAEELFVSDCHESTKHFLLLIRKAIEAGELFCVATIRSDRYSALQTAKELDGIYQNTFSLAPVSGGEISQIINGPAQIWRKLAGPAAPVFAPEVSQALMAEIEGQEDALPLLAFAMARLINEHVGTGEQSTPNIITPEDLEKTGGVSETIEIEAEKALNYAKVEKSQAVRQKILRETFIPRLARIDRRTRTPERRVAALSNFKNPRLTKLIEAFVKRRLLTKKAGKTYSTVEVAHEALLRKWPTLAKILDEDTEDLLHLDTALNSAALWKANGKQSEYTDHRGGRLENLENLASKSSEWIDILNPASEYILACRKDENARVESERKQLDRQRVFQRWIGGLTLTAMVITMVGLVFLGLGQRNLQRSEALTLSRAVDVALKQGSEADAIRLAILSDRKKWAIGRIEESNAAIAHAAQSTRQLMMVQHDGSVTGAVFNANETRLLTWGGDNTVRLWDTRTGAQIGPVLQHGGGVWSAVLNSEGTRILTWSEDNMARLWDAKTGAQIGRALKHDSTVLRAMFDSDETRILTWSEEYVARLWNAETGTQIGQDFHYGDTVSGAVFNSNGTRVLTWSDDNTTRLWDTTTREQKGPVLRDGDTVLGAKFSADETRIMTWSQDGSVRLRDAATGAQIGQALQHNLQVMGAELNSDGTRILTWSRDKTARLWNAATSTQIGPVLPHGQDIWGALFNADHTRFLTWSGDRTAQLWDATNGVQIGPDLQHGGYVRGAKFNTDGTRILTWSWDKTARLWDTTTGAQIGSALQHDGRVFGAAFNVDETRILTWSLDGSARIWNANTGPQIGPALRHGGPVLRAKFNSDGTRILTRSRNKTARLWDAATGVQIKPVLQHADTVRGAEFNADETRILTWSDDGSARLWDATTGIPIGPALQHGGPVTGAKFNADETRVLTWGRDKTARLWDAATGVQIRPVLQHGDIVKGAEFNADGTRILTWSWDKTARLWNAVTGAQIGPDLQHDGDIRKAVFNPDETRILTWSDDSSARLWDATIGIQIDPALRHGGPVLGAEFNAEGTSILTWSQDGSARLWNALTGMQVGPVLQHGKTVRGAVFNADETRILTWSADNTARLWDTATGAQIGPALQHDRSVRGAKFNADDTRILTWSSDKTARLWNAVTGAPIGLVRRHDANIRKAEFNADETRILTWSDDSSTRLWDSATGMQIGPALKHDDRVLGAMFNKDETRILTWSWDKTARLWDVSWGSLNLPPGRFSQKLCAEKLRGNTIKKKGIFISPRHISAADIERAPILRGREGEDVCDWIAPWWYPITRRIIGVLPE